MLNANVLIGTAEYKTAKYSLLKRWGIVYNNLAS